MADADWNNAAAVANSGEIVADWEARSARLRAQHKTSMDLRYGPAERNRIDFFPGRKEAPLLAFIHGGYWQARSKEVFSFVAEGPLACGMNVALIGYTLAPQKRLDGIVAEIRAALDWLDEKHGNKLLVSGWSAGGHLTAMAIDHRAVKAGLAISGIYDLEPIRHCYVNDKLGMDEDEARRNSPGPTTKPLVLAYGADELPNLRTQSEHYARRLGRNAMALEGHNHFTILEELASPHGVLTAVLRTL